MSSDRLLFLRLNNCIDVSLVNGIMKPGQKDLDFDLGDPHVVSINKDSFVGLNAHVDKTITDTIEHRYKLWVQRRRLIQDANLKTYLDMKHSQLNVNLSVMPGHQYESAKEETRKAHESWIQAVGHQHANNLLTIVYLVGIRMFWSCQLKNIVPKLHQYESSEEEVTTTQAPWILKNNCMINLVSFCCPDYWLVETPSKYKFWVGNLFVEEVELNHWLSNELCDGISECKRVHSEYFVVDCGLWQMLLDSGQAEGAKMGENITSFVSV